MAQIQHCRMRRKPQMRLNEPRISPLSDDQLAPEQQAVIALLNPKARRLNLFRTAVRAPEAMRGLLAWGNYIQSRANDLPPRQKEIVILRIGYLCRAGYEWAQHEILGQQAGLTEDEIARLKKRAAGWEGADAALIRAADELHADQFISDSVWVELCRFFSEKQRMDIVFTAAQYVQICMILNTFGVQLDPGLTLDPELAKAHR